MSDPLITIVNNFAGSWKYTQVLSALRENMNEAISIAVND